MCNPDKIAFFNISRKFCNLDEIICILHNARAISIQIICKVEIRTSL